MKEILWATLSSDAYWSVNKNIAKNIGIEEAVFLSDLISKEKYFHSKNQLDDKGGFFNTTENLINDLGISERSKKRIQALLIKLNIVSVKKRGVPAKNYWYLNHNEIIKIMSSSQVIFSQTDVDPTGQDCIDPTGQTDGDPAINKNKVIKIKNNNKELFLNEHKIIAYWKSKNTGQAEPVIPNKATLNNIRATLNQYSYSELVNCIDNLFNDKWSIENKQIRLNRLIKADKRDQNMFKYKGKSEHINDEERVQAILATRKKFEGLNDTRKR